ncbi:phosphoesterase, partial [Halobium palmae]
PLRPDPFADHLGVDVADLDWGAPELVVFPAFNRRSGGTWANVEGQSFLSPFLPDGLASGEAYLLDGTRLGDYRRV